MSLARALLPALVVALVAVPALAQPKPRPLPRPLPRPMPAHPLPALSPPRPAPPTSARPAGSGLRAHLALAVAERALATDATSERVRGIERLATLGDAASVERLLVAISPDGGAARDASARLATLRALAPFAGRVAVRDLLVRTVVAEPAPGPLGALTRATAGLGLAASGDAASVDALVGLARQQGPIGDVARRALVAHPPRGAIVRDAEAIGASAADLLGALRDRRGLVALRKALSRPSDDPLAPSAAHLAAAKALATLGDASPAAPARTWLASPDARVRVAAATVLATLRTPDATAAIAALLGADATRDAALALAVEHPSPALGGPLALALDASAGDARALACEALGRAGGAAALARLGAALTSEGDAFPAARALATTDDEGALVILVRALREPATRRMAARGAVARAYLRGERADGLRAALDALMVAREPADRAVAAFGYALLSEDHARELATRTDLVAVRAAARAAWAHGARALAPFAERAAREPDLATREALAAAFAFVPADGVETPALVAVATESRAAGAVATLALARRDAPEARAWLDDAARASDRGVRGALAWGLAESPEADAPARLAALWPFEPEARVRRAVVRALASRRGGDADATLRDAAALDPDDDARTAAAGALTGTARVAAPPPSRSLVWLRVPAHLRGESVVRLVLRDGRALPVAPDADGYVVAPAVPAEDAALDLASAPGAEDARRP